MISGTTNVLQQGPAFCLTLLPHSQHHDLIASLICGLPLAGGESKQVFLDTGLIHVMVVSGAHLMFLESLLARTPLWLRLPVLGFYCWLTGFGAPVVKAFAHRTAEIFLRPYGWSGLWIEAVAVALAVTVYPWWLMSRSLQMSWMCSLALSLPRLLRWRALDQSLKAYILLFVFVGGSLIGVCWNTLAAPFVGLILFPVSLLTILLPFLSGPVDRVWDLFLLLLSYGPKGSPSSWFFASRDLFWIPPLVHVALLAGEVRWRRARAFSC